MDPQRSRGEMVWGHSNADGQEGSSWTRTEKKHPPPLGLLESTPSTAGSNDLQWSQCADTGWRTLKEDKKRGETVSARAAFRSLPHRRTHLPFVINQKKMTKTSSWTNVWKAKGAIQRLNSCLSLAMRRNHGPEPRVWATGQSHGSGLNCEKETLELNLIVRLEFGCKFPRNFYFVKILNVPRHSYHWKVLGSHRIM